ncbi:mannose-6-phosphate isomerase [Maribacter dokdonensis]|uniref:Phosphohexomutase n=1 Tax=Maribacter dokdonensis TaxID=320912 RepID=A0ABY0TZ45_9FLAO|nr:type I phosphomannose isomerase catalytic subunit [Maribacter dokdonensis]SDR79447.1 mannose-6-phosphate isomerase [Maribacter dokdonensis]
MNTDFQQYAYIPLKQFSNRVWRTYEGGALIDKWKKDSPEVDGSMPEEWIMSTVTARGKGRPENEGLSMVQTPSGTYSLKELVASNKELYLGKALADKFGTTGVLIKMLDSKERLTIQVHPDKDYAKTMLDSAFGKTESWYVLNKREINGEKSVIYMGFKEGVTREQWEILFKNQDIEGMLDCLHKIEVNPGDAYMIYGGVPHAIGSGCFLMEVQEPTDYTMRVEKVTPAGLTISDELIHQGVGEQNMLDCFHYDGCSYEEALKRWKVSPKTIDSSDKHTLNTIFNESHTDCFGLSELDLTVNGEHSLKSNGSFFVAVIYYGEGTIISGGKEYSFAQGDEIFFSAAIDEVKFSSTIASKILLCYPPS